MTNEETIKELEKQLEDLKKENTDQKKIKQLQKQIRAFKLSKTKIGKFIDVVGGFGAKVGKKIITPSPQVKGKKGKSVKDVNKAIEDAINSVPQ